MKVLVACEESQAVTIAFRNKGHEAYSNDVLPCSGNHPEWHLQMDVFEAIKLKKWDMMVAFPPCTHLAVSGAKHFEQKRKDGRQRQAIEFFMDIYNAPIPMKSIENPVGIISGDYITKHFPDLAEKYSLPIKPSQTIQPWQYGDEAQKTTCLWLQNLPLLRPTNVVGKGEFYISPDGKYKMPAWSHDMVYEGKKIGWNTELIKHLRSKTFPGIAHAMATQWG
jgi:site-specific DNA-cytosine methylase